MYLHSASKKVIYLLQLLNSKSTKKIWGRIDLHRIYGIYFIDCNLLERSYDRRSNNTAQSRNISGAATEDTAAVADNLSMRRGGQGFPGSTWRASWALTFQSSDVTSLLLGTSCPPSRMQCRSTSCVEPLVLFSLRFQIRAVESPDLQNTRGDGNPAAYPWAIPVISCIC